MEKKNNDNKKMLFPLTEITNYNHHYLFKKIFFFI